MEEQQIWDRLLNSQDATVRKLATDLDVKSTLFGERHDTGLKAEVSNLDVTHFQLEIIFGATIRGLFRNLFQMMPIPLLLANNKTTLVATGKAADQPYIHYLKVTI